MKKGALMWINCGAINILTGQRFKTKKALKEAVKTDASIVKFDRTTLELFGSGDLFCDEIPEGAKLSVVGPDPFSDRRWYATVERRGDVVKVS